jgi:hypothetical protein
VTNAAKSIIRVPEDVAKLCSAGVGSREYFDGVEARKHFVEAHIPGFAQFERWAGKRVLEVGCGRATIPSLAGLSQQASAPTTPRQMLDSVSIFGGKPRAQF